MRTAVTVAVLTLAGAAGADEIVLTDVGFHITTPSGWKQSPETAAPLVARLRDADHDAGGLAWVGKPGALFVLWRTAHARAADPVAAVEAALDAFAAREGNVIRTSRAIGEWDATAFVDVEPERGTLVLARTSAFVDGKGRVREIRAECVVRKEQLDDGRKACDAALGSFALAVDDADLSPLRAPDAGPAAAAPAPRAAAAPSKAAPRPSVGAGRPWWAGPGVVLVVVLLPVIGFFGYRLLKELRK